MGASFADAAPVSRRRGARADRLDHFAGLVELEARVAVEHLRPVALAEVAKEVGLPRGPGEELLVDARVVEARHRSGVDAKRARDDDEVRALEGAVEIGRAHV